MWNCWDKLLPHTRSVITFLYPNWLTYIYSAESQINRGLWVASYSRGSAVLSLPIVTGTQKAARIYLALRGHFERAKKRNKCWTGAVSHKTCKKMMLLWNSMFLCLSKAEFLRCVWEPGHVHSHVWNSIFMPTGTLLQDGGMWLGIKGFVNWLLLAALSCLLNCLKTY